MEKKRISKKLYRDETRKLLAEKDKRNAEKEKIIEEEFERNKETLNDISKSLE